MRTLVIVLLGVLFMSNCGAVALGASQGGNASQPQSPAANIDQLAQQVFASADQNRNHVLNKGEFKNAQALLEAAVNEWGRAGLIGKPKRPGSKDQASSDQSAISLGASAGKLAKSNKVSPAEFTFFAHAVVDEADQRWRQMNAVVAAQRKAYNAQRAAFRNRGMRFPTPYPYSY